jgi:hypothetical protein
MYWCNRERNNYQFFIDGAFVSLQFDYQVFRNPDTKTGYCFLKNLGDIMG